MLLSYLVTNDKLRDGTMKVIINFLCKQRQDCLVHQIILLCLFTVGFLPRISFSQGVVTVWMENWEGTWTNDWNVDAGTWEVGVPTPQPDSAHSPKNCAGTVLGGNYPPNANTRLIRRTPFDVPPASEKPRLRFWHWYSISSGDTGRVQIRMVGTNKWITISDFYMNTGGGVWTCPSLDISAYAGQRVELAFYFTSDASNNSLNRGWYVDDIALIAGPKVFKASENWENGLGDWYVDKGSWEVGMPTAGPSSAHSPKNCAGTVLRGNYHQSTNTKLISIPYKVLSANANPTLQFWHWYSFSSNDSGVVEIRVGNGASQIVLGPYKNTSGGVWTNVFLDLKPFANSTIQLNFRFASDGSNTSLSTGWYIDDITLDGVTNVKEVSSEHDAIKSFTLYQNHPNPFNPSTTIIYDLPRASQVEIEIFTLLGERIRALVKQQQAAGQHRLQWDGRDEKGAPMPSGVYLYRLRADEFVQTRKMILAQ